MVRFCDSPSSSDCETVEQLRSLGAIPFCHTNLSHAMSALECSNPLFGKTSNVYNKDKDCGGSSGGEATLIAAGGSILGVGNDIGGSLRNPAALSNIFSLRPTFGRHLSQSNVSGFSFVKFIVRYFYDPSVYRFAFQTISAMLGYHQLVVSCHLLLVI